MHQYKHFFPRNSLLTVGLLSSLTIGLLNAHPVQASSLQLNYIGQSIFPTSTTYQGTMVGGLSGITYNPNLNEYYIISDDRSQINPARFYTATIDPTKFNVTGINSGVTFTGVTTLLQSNNQPFPTNSLDPEGIALFNGNSVFVSSEGEVSADRIINPFVNKFDLTTGQQNQSLPIPNQFIPAPNSIPTSSGVRNNLALESLTITPNQRYLFTASENALVQDGPLATLSNGSPSRIVQYDLTTGKAIAQFLYNTDPVALPPKPANAFNTNGLVDLLALDNTGKNFLALERSFSAGATGTPGGTGNTVKIYQVSLAGSTDISGDFSIDGVSGIIPAQKSLLLDLTTLDIPIDNIEGITFGSTLPNGDRSLVLVSDNNFSVTQFTQFLAFQVRSVPEPSALLGLLAIGVSSLWVSRRGKSQ
jgi:hypothetical protein